MRPAIKDSLTSGQPLYLLYWNSKRGWPAGRAPLLRALETHATGSVRLQVTGSPPTTKGAPWAFPFDPFPQESALKGKAAAMSPWTTCLRFKAFSSVRVMRSPSPDRAKSCCECLQHGLGVVLNSPQECLCRTRRLPPPLLPVAQRSNINVKKFREFRLAQARDGANLL